MRNVSWFAKLSLIVLVFSFGANSRADDNVCLINNSSYNVKLDVQGTSPDFNIAAKGGDQNKCWHFATFAIMGAGYPIKVEARNADGSMGPNGYADVDLISDIEFFNPTIGAGYFNFGGSRWGANSNRCGQKVCVWHTDKTDVWRFYIIDKP